MHWEQFLPDLETVGCGWHRAGALFLEASSDSFSKITQQTSIPRISRGTNDHARAVYNPDNPAVLFLTYHLPG